MSTPFVGEIKMVGFNFAPRGYLFCHGQLLSIQQNTALFSLLGTQFGGNGTTNFQLPNLQGRVPLKFGQGPGLSQYVIGEATGTETVTLTSAQMPAHTHTAGGSGSPTTRDPRGHVPATSLQNRYAATPNTTMHASAVAIAGGGQAHDNMAPFLAVSYVIATQGIFPARN